MIHAALGAAVLWVGSFPDSQLELQQPRSSQLGLTERVEVDIEESAPSSPPPEPERASPSPAPSSERSHESKPTPAPDEKPLDAGPPADAGTPSPTRDAGAPPVARGEPPQLDAYAPQGTQLALRLDMKAIRTSPLASEARALIEALPDWQALLAGSGIDPVEDLDKLLIASPDMRRAHVVVAGSFRGGRATAREAVQRLAEARGQQARWRRVRGIRVAPWRDSDPTERILALVGPGRFTITRPEDLRRVIAIAHALSERRGRTASTTDEAAGALLGMPEDVVLSVTVEGARAFLRGPANAIPERAEATLQQVAERRVKARVTAQYETPEQAEKGVRFWESLRSRYASHPLVALLGMGSILRESAVEREGDELHGRATLTLRQLRLLLGTVRSLFEGPKPPPAPTPPPPPPPTPTPPPSPAPQPPSPHADAPQEG